MFKLRSLTRALWDTLPFLIVGTAIGIYMYIQAYQEYLHYLTIKNVFNVLLPVMSCTSSLFISSTLGQRRLLGYWLGLLNQPLWYYLAWSTGNWGVAVNATFYTWCWIKGIYGHTPFIQANPHWYKRYLPHRHEYVSDYSRPTEGRMMPIICKHCKNRSSYDVTGE